MKTTKILITLLIISILTLTTLLVYENFKRDGVVFGGNVDCNPIGFKKEQKDGVYYLVWKTTDECIGFAKFGTNVDDFPYYGVNVKGQVRTKNHEIMLSGIEGGSKYYFVIVSGEKTFGKSGLPLEISF